MQKVSEFEKNGLTNGKIRQRKQLDLLGLKMTVRFDDSLPALIDILEREIGRDELTKGVVVRDVGGRLAFVSASSISEKSKIRIGRRLMAALGAYARPDRVIASVDDFGVESLLHDKSALVASVSGCSFRLIDRRLVGADWLRSPAPRAPQPSRFVFASIKGGVGRSTALAVAAAHLAARGKRVLAIDLDMEAPGLGSLLLDENTLPEFGLIDALVENGLGPLDGQFLADIVGPSRLAGNHGRIDVIPAFGRRSVENPGEVLSKIARAYMDDVGADGKVASILDQISSLIDEFSDPNRYDVILIDARAGLHETTATAILGLGAEVFLFGIDEPQTFQGYSALLSHLARFRDVNSKSAPEWLDRISMIQAKAPLDADARQGFSDRCLELFLSTGLESAGGIVPSEPQPPAEPFDDVPWDDAISDEEALPLEGRSFRDPVPIMHDDIFRQFDPRRQRDLLSEVVYEKSYGLFIGRLLESFPGIERRNA